MAHRTTHRRILAGPDSKVSSMDDPHHHNHHPIFKTEQNTKPTSNSDPTTVPTSKPSSMSNHNLSKTSLNPKKGHVVRTSQKPAAASTALQSLLVDTHLQGKAMSASAIVEYSSKTVKDMACRDQRSKTKKSTKEWEKKKFCHLIENEKKDSYEEEEEKEKFGVLQRHSVSLPLAGVSTGAGAGTGRRRRSFGGSHVELADVFASNGVKVVSVDMPPFMQIHAVEFARKAHDSLEKFTSKTLACTLKKEFDGVYGPAWHCIVGTSFGSFVTHSVE